ncbi:MAG: D-aminoacyl-tRNA deacylase [Anaerolineae bacterium]
MRVLLQRVTAASVAVDGTEVGAIGPGLLALVGVRQGDGLEQSAWLAEKVANLRVFEDADGKMNRSVLDSGGEVLVVSQFTLYGDARKGRRPSFTEAAPPEVAEPLIEDFVRALGAAGVPTQTGTFRAHMLVSLTNDGPVTILLER